ncbi:unnamed protein product, partial [Effrenium voratum]
IGPLAPATYWHMSISSDDADVQVVTMRRLRPRGKLRATPKGGRAQTIVLDAPTRRREVRARQARATKVRKKRAPDIQVVACKRRRAAVQVDLDDDDQVIETCCSYEEAFLGYKTKKPSTSTWLVPRQLLPAVQAQAPQLPSSPPEEEVATAPSASGASAHVSCQAKAQAVRAAGRAAARAAAALAAAARAAAARAAERAAARAAINSSPVDLPKQLQLPAIADADPKPRAESPPKAPGVTKKLLEMGVISEEAEASPEAPYSEAYVERLRCSADCHYRKCCVCGERFAVDQLRLGYVPDTAAEPRWLHTRCLASDALRMQPGQVVAFAPAVAAEERHRILSILSIRRAGHSDAIAAPVVLRPRLWRHGPGVSQRWQRCAVPTAGAPRPPRLRYMAPILSRVSQEARVVLFRARHRRLAANQTRANLRAVPRRVTASGPSVVGQRAQVAATTRGRVRNGDDANAESEQTDRRQRWVRRSALGARAKEFFAAAPIVFLDKDRREEEPCIICHEPLLEGDEARRLPCCHTFHRCCIDRWLRVKAVCPLDKLTVDQLLAAPKAQERVSAAT